MNAADGGGRGGGAAGQIAVGIVGLGGMGTKHAGNVRDLGATIAGGADVAAGARESFAETFDAPTYEGHEALYEAADPDAVVITTPNAFHVEAAVAALERDVPVLVEKPLAATLEGAERVAAAAEGSRGFCMVGFHNRFCAAADLFREFVSEGRFGELRHIDANYLRRRGIPGVGSWFTSEELAGGGALIDIGVHALDFALYLAGFPDVSNVSGVVRTDFGDRADYADPDGWGDSWGGAGGTFDVDDSATALVRCEDGLTISLDVSWAANRAPNRETVVRGTDAGARLTLGGSTLSVNETRSSGSDYYVDAEYEGGRDRSGYAAEAELFLDAVGTGEPPETNTVEEGLAVQRVLDAIYRSSEAGTSVSVR